MTKKITELTEDTTPSLTDLIESAKNPGGTPVSRKVQMGNLLKLLSAYIIPCWISPSVSPADATTYVFSAFQTGLGSSAANNRLYIPRAGIITSIYIAGVCTTGSNEASSMWLRLNDTTDTLITSAAVFNANPFLFSNTSLNIPVVPGDYVTIKWTTPTWATNPTTLNMFGEIFVS